MGSFTDTLSPADLVARYKGFSDPATLKKQTSQYVALSPQDSANLFAYNLAKQTLGREPLPSEIVAGQGTLTDAGVAQALSDQKAALASAAPPGSNIDTTG